MHFIGIDGCGKYSKILILDGNKKVAARHSGASVDLKKLAATAVAHNTDLLVREVYRLANTSMTDCGGVCFAADRTVAYESEAAIAKMFKNMGFACSIKVVCTEKALLSAKTQGAPGALLLVDDDVTGYIITESGDTSIGGYGRLVETGGSAYSMGLSALRAVISAYDGRGAVTALSGMFLKYLDIKTIPEALAIINHTDYDLSNIAGLSALVKAAAENNDRTALDIEVQAAHHLASFAAALMDRIYRPASATLLVMGGSYLLLYERLNRQLSALLRTKYPDIQMLLADEKPEAGAAIIAANG